MDVMTAAPPSTLIARLWTDADTEQLVQWFAEDSTLWQYIPGMARPLTSDELRAHAVTRQVQQHEGRALVIAVEREGRLACQCTIFPRQGTEGACHFLVARWAKGHGVALIREALAEAQRRGLTKIVGIPSPLLPQDVYIRFMRRVGFTIKFYGEITT
jgi:RimJ/RimL family protein N-acetyltransferase